MKDNENGVEENKKNWLCSDIIYLNGDYLEAWLLMNSLI